MPLAHLIFFEDPRELTDEQIEEARALGHLREDPPAADDKPPAADLFSTPPQVPDLSQADAGQPGDDDSTDEQGA